MRKSKKILSLIMVVIITAITLTAFQAAAIPDVTYTFEGISAEKAEQIFNALYGNLDDNSIQPYSFWCLFGHSKATGGLVVIEHKYYVQKMCKIDKESQRGKNWILLSGKKF